MDKLLLDIGISIMAATFAGVVFHIAKQPIILAYLVAGAIIGPQVGLGFIESAENIEIISEIGLILLLFIIGLELDMKKIIASGRQLLVTGAGQFLLCAALGLPFFWLLGYGLFGSDNIDGLYLSLLAALSSTAIVVKILYDKFETDTLPGRLTIGILVFQDIWAILILALQPNFMDPKIMLIGEAVLKSILLLAAGFFFSKYLLQFIFEKISRAPEMVVAISIGWCTCMAGLAGYIGLSKEMGALVAGFSVSTFPYSIHVTAKTLPLRDFFLTLFFISLGMKIVEPRPEILGTTAILVGFIIVSRFVTIYPLSRLSGGGRRTAFITSLNLGQLSEFSLVIAALGVQYGHIGKDLLAACIYAMAFTSAVSSYLIKYNHQIYSLYNTIITRFVLKKALDEDEGTETTHHPVVLLGYHRGARALVKLISTQNPQMLEKLKVIDFNLELLKELRGMRVAGMFGDISSMETLTHAHLGGAKIIVSTVQDSFLRGTNNIEIVRMCRMLAPSAIIISVADSENMMNKLKAVGSDEVVLPYSAMSDKVYSIIETGLSNFNIEAP